MCNDADAFLFVVSHYARTAAGNVMAFTVMPTKNPNTLRMYDITIGVKNSIPVYHATLQLLWLCCGDIDTIINGYGLSMFFMQ